MFSGILDNMPSVNAIDAILVLVILLGVLSGWARGFVVAALQLLTLAASLLLAFVAYRYPSALLDELVASLAPWSMAISFIALFLLSEAILGALESRVFRRIPRNVHVHPANRALGLLPGAVNGLLHATVVSLVLLTVPLADRVSTLARDSAIASTLSAPAEWLEARLTPIFDPAIQRTMQALMVPAESPAVVQLGFKLTSAKLRADLEAQMLEMVNAERAAHALKPLRADPELAEVARSHSRDMFARGYFSHVSPEGVDPFARMRKAQVRFITAGENLALAQTLPRAHQGLMNSPGHRANILRPQFGRLGVGVLDGGMHGLMITQEFRN